VTAAGAGVTLGEAFTLGRRIFGGLLAGYQARIAGS
jgi:hypothetical protein